VISPFIKKLMHLDTLKDAEVKAVFGDAPVAESAR
ncbi:MAG: hypothetical protein RLZZ58_1902, partial [Pseudomonadota bacterium]